jgi:hypothetical protein
MIEPTAGLSEADFRGCRFIEGEVTPLRAGLFCGAPTPRPGGSWCRAHHAVVWKAPRPGKMRLRKSGAALPIR